MNHSSKHSFTRAILTLWAVVYIIFFNCPLLSSAFLVSLNETSAASSDQTAPVDLLPVSPKRPGPHMQHAIRMVCQDPAFQLTLENWRESRASAFLRQWAASTRHKVDGRGLIESLATVYLGRSEFDCTIRSTHACTVTCPEVVALVSDPVEARALYFVLTSARHYLEIMEGVDHALLAAQVNVGQWTDSMARTMFWTQDSDHDKVLKATVALVNQFIPFVLFTIAPMVPFHFKQNELEKQLDDLDKDLKWKELGEEASKAALQELNDKKEKLTEKIGDAQKLADWTKSGYNAVALGAPTLGIPGTALNKWDGYERAPATNVAELGLAVSQLVSEARGKNAQAIQETFRGKAMDAEGHTMLGNILDSGNFIAVDSQMIHLWTGEQVEKRLTDALKYRVLSEALKSQGVYIHCTKDMDARTCQGDRRGPQKLKACIDGRVCYLNKWNGRGYWWRHHVEEPFGTSQMADWPFLVRPEEIIKSSYKTYQMLKETPDALNGFMKNANMFAAHDFLDASVAGAFFIPVCINDRFHQNAKHEMTLWDNFNQNSEQKTLPCSCGLNWGDETESFWRETGLAKAPQNKRYRTTMCPKQLKKKMDDGSKLERFVADCRLGIHYSGMIKGYKETPHEHCEAVLPLIGRHGKGPDDIDPFLRLALECKAGLHKTSVKKKARVECQPYLKKEGFEDLTLKSNPMAAKWGFT
ncbi:hypothetical protein DFH27DRAFT_610488 [Peziza echinospora]|nr:hypothetical protein DFH27DRAFT_610488 [Peziza echinospora]